MHYTDENILKFFFFVLGFKAVSVIGGLDVAADRKKIQNARAIVGTPGRVLHLIQNDVLNTSEIKLLILDEADKMVSATFRGDFEKIYKSLPSKKQMIACSATFCNDLDSDLAKYMRNPFLISTEKRATSLLGIKQLIYNIPEEKSNILEMQAKTAALKQIFSNMSFKQCLVFSNSQSRADSYRSFLHKDGWPCEVICGAQDQKTRLDAFNKFREFKTRILIATDLMARGIDSENVNLVINLELPDDAATYLHRVGRAGRFGSHGIAVSFIASKKDREKLRKILEGIGFGMEILKFPKNKIVDLWNFNDPEGEKHQLGVFDMNENIECEKENINNNAQVEAKPTDYEKMGSKQRTSQSNVKMDVLKQLIDSNSNVKPSNNRNGNLFSDFIEDLSSNLDEKNENTNFVSQDSINQQNGSQAIDEKNERANFVSQDSVNSQRDSEAIDEKGEKAKLVSQDSVDQQKDNKAIDEISDSKEILNTSNIAPKSRDSLVNLVCDQRKNEVAKPERNVFDDFNATVENDSLTTDALIVDSKTNIKDTEPTSCSEKPSLDEYEQDTGDDHATKESSTSGRKSIETGVVPEEKSGKCDKLRNSLRSLLIENEPDNKNSEDIFDDFISSQCVNSNIEECSKLCGNDVNHDASNTPNARNSSKSKVSKSKNRKPSKQAIKEAIREVHNNIISSCDSQAPPPSINSFSEPQPSTSFRSGDVLQNKSDTSNYPRSSSPTCGNQTKSDLNNISSLTEELNISFNASDFVSEQAKVDAPQQKRPEMHRENSASTSEGWSTVDSATETASEHNESSGFDEETSEASSGVVTSEISNRSSSSDSSTVTTDHSDSDSSDSKSSTETEVARSPNGRRCELFRNKRRARVSTNRTNQSSAHTISTANWNNLYWNQFKQIQDYVELCRYAKQQASQYS